MFVIQRQNAIVIAVLSIAATFSLPVVCRAQPVEIVPPFMVTTPDSVILEVEFIPAFHQDSVGKPVVVLLHMLSSNRSSWADYMQQLAVAGMDVLTYDARGHGHSTTRRGKEYKYPEFGTEDYALMVDDLATVLDAVRDSKNAKNLHAQAYEVEMQRALNRADWDNMVIIGASIGSSVALLYAAAHPEVDGVVLLSPGLDYRGLKMLPAIKQYAGRSIFIAAAEGDTYSWRSSQTLDSLAGDNKVNWQSSTKEHGTNLFTADSTLAPALTKYLQDMLIWKPLKEKVRREGKK